MQDGELLPQVLHATELSAHGGRRRFSSL